MAVAFGIGFIGMVIIFFGIAIIFIADDGEGILYGFLFGILGGLLLFFAFVVADSNYIESKTPLGVEVAVNIDYEEMNSVDEKSEAQIAVLKNMGKIEKAYAIRKPLQEKINLILVNKDGTKVNLTLPNDLKAWTGIDFKN